MGPFNPNDRYRIQTRKMTVKCLKLLNELKDNSLAIIEAERSGQSKFSLHSRTLILEHGICEYIDGSIDIGVKFYIAQKFGANDVVWPVDYLVKGDIWHQPKRWKYLDFMIAELQSMLDQLDEAEGLVK